MYNIEKNESGYAKAFFVTNMLERLAGRCDAVYNYNNTGGSMLPQELYDYVNELIANNELKIWKGHIKSARNSVGFDSRNESYFFEYGNEIELRDCDEPISDFCMVDCKYAVYTDGLENQYKKREKVYMLYIPRHKVRISNQTITIDVDTTDFAREMPVKEYSKLMEMISTHSMIPSLSIGVTFFNNLGIKKIEKKMLELALKKYTLKPE